MAINDVTDSEEALVLILGKAWDQFLELPVEHPSDQGEFLQAIHRAQLMILSRAGRRQINSKTG